MIGLIQQQTPGEERHSPGFDGCMRLDGLGAELAARGGDGDVAEALGAGLGGYRFGYRRAESFQQILGGDDEEEVDDGSDKQKVDDCGEEVTVEDLASVDVAFEIAEVGLADDGSQERIDNFFSERGDDGREGSADDDGDSKINDVATQNEIAESFEHEVSLLSFDRVWNRWITACPVRRV